MRLVFLGPPGAGKGTLAKMVYDDYNIIHISTGDIFRAAVKNRTPLGVKVKDILNSGSLIPDELTIELVKARLEEPDAADGFILDGYPRTIPQAEALSRFAQPDAVINFEIPDEEIIIQRLTGRRTCKNCSAIFHIYNTPPKEEGVCDNCGKALFTRDDDKLEAVRHRLAVYKEQTAPLIEFYRKSGLLKNIDASGKAVDTEKQITETLKAL